MSTQPCTYPGVGFTYGICKSRETVGMPFLQASQDSVDSNTATRNEQIHTLAPQNTLANHWVMKSLTLLCNNCLQADRDSVKTLLADRWGRGEGILQHWLPMTQPQRFRNHTPTESQICFKDNGGKESRYHPQNCSLKREVNTKQKNSERERHFAGWLLLIKTSTQNADC